MSSLEQNIDDEPAMISLAGGLSNSYSLLETLSSSLSSCSRTDESARSPGKGKQTLQPPSPQNIEDEILQEIMQSRTYGECNLAALQLYLVPSGLPLDSLTLLNLSQNNLVELPQEMFIHPCCQHLNSIEINSNKLKHLPASLFYLPKVKILMLNGNHIATLPQLDPDRKILPSLERVGLENNVLKEFPICFFEHCQFLREVLLGQNEEMLKKVLPYESLSNCILARMWNKNGEGEQTLLRIDNRPLIVEQIATEDWSTNLSWLSLSLNKIYPDKVIDFLFIGSLRTAQTASVYDDCGIRYVLTIGRDMEVKVEPGMFHRILLFDDFPEENIAFIFKEAFEFIDQARKSKFGVLVHCFAGLSRSVAIVAAYIMREMHISYEQAISIIKRARPAAHPNEGFVKTLLESESKLINGFY
ncbi:unnamed protein product [Phytomonas sp. EM1]|nr:unnamed protein product [Phytomonas sp. EM1]|eukprot:CCW62447.1 unnamed protein product [Phytomonas sp. isolate EM1]